MQQGFCGGVSEAGFGNTGGKQKGEESEAVALRCGLLHSLVRGFVYDIPAGIGDGERNRKPTKGSGDETDGERDRKPTKGVAMKQMVSGIGNQRKEAAMKLMASGFADAEERR